MQQNNLPSHPPPPFARPDCVGVGPPDCRLNDCALVLDPYAGGAPLLAVVTCVMTLAAFGIGDASDPPAPPPEYEPPPSSPSPSRVHIVRPILVGDPGVRGAGGMEGRSSSRSTSSAWNAGFVGVACGSAVMFLRPRYAPPTSRRPLSALAECQFKWATKKAGGDEWTARCARARLCLPES